MFLIKPAGKDLFVSFQTSLAFKKQQTTRNICGKTFLLLFMYYFTLLNY